MSARLSTAKQVLRDNGFLELQIRALRKIQRRLNRNKSIENTVEPPIDQYYKWVINNYPDGVDYARMLSEVTQFAYKPLISIICPLYNTHHEYLREAIESVQSQAYSNWELILVDDCSPDGGVREIASKYAEADSRVKTLFLETNHHIAGATNEGIKIANGEFISLLDHDDIIWPNALFEVVKALNNDNELDLIYTDEDKVTGDRKVHFSEFFKPDWNPDFLRSINYITHFLTVRKSLLDHVGYEDGKFNGTQDWELILRVTRATEKIHHIPKVLYSWRFWENSTAMDMGTKPYVTEAQRNALIADGEARGIKGYHVDQSSLNQFHWHVHRDVIGTPKVSIVIPSKNQYSVIKKCLDSIYKQTTYKNFEIVLVDTGSTDDKVHKLYRDFAKIKDNFIVTKWIEDKFSYSNTCNFGAKNANGEYLIMLNNDTEVITPDWIELFLGDAMRPEIGAVGCLLLYPGGRYIQHAGVAIGFGGVAAPALAYRFPLEPNMHLLPHFYANTKHNVTAVTAACLMISKEKFNEAGGFDPEFAVTYNDVALCLKLRELGYWNLYTPYIKLIHHESISLGKLASKPKGKTTDRSKKRKNANESAKIIHNDKSKRDVTEFEAAENLFKERWGKYIQHDPAFSDNYSKQNPFLTHYSGTLPEQFQELN